MTTFSQLVDDLVRETRRPDMVNDIINYTNQTIREVHFNERNAAVMFQANFTELLLLAGTDAGFQWEIDSATFQAMQVVHYVDCDVYPAHVVPSRALREASAYYYRVGNSYVFSGYGGANTRIGLGFFSYPRRLTYYPKGLRPAEYQPETEWEYLPPFGESLDAIEAAQRYTSNWLLLRWPDVIAEGVRAKVYKRVSDDSRAKTCYSLYMSLRQGLVSSESANLGGYA